MRFSKRENCKKFCIIANKSLDKIAKYVKIPACLVVIQQTKLGKTGSIAGLAPTGTRNSIRRRPIVPQACLMRVE
ncbi:MAG: hypothetical protein AMJ75_04410 [Phycisphaerae bacterium SM1_79]|nr:MAG: hypothetical protein AMJ75_04410 [Phycisphaerae bacterium SM1_79]